MRAPAAPAVLSPVRLIVAAALLLCACTYENRPPDPRADDGPGVDGGVDDPSDDDAPSDDDGADHDGGDDDGGDGGRPGDDGGARDGGAATSDGGAPCAEAATWTCAGDARARCVDGAPQVEACPHGCRDDAELDGDARCVEPAPAWDCASSALDGVQYWTCADGAVHACVDGAPLRVPCAAGCAPGPLATDDRCFVPGDAPPPTPPLSIEITGGLFAEDDVRPLLEEGLALALARLHEKVGLPAGASVPPITVRYAAWSEPYCGGIAYATSTDISCPYDYPISGDNQNYVVNITMHEIGHILAQQLIAPPSLRTTCTNEGIATWIAAPWWANHQSQDVGTLREAARGAIATSGVHATMSDCVLASDAWYKVYGSFFEHLEAYDGALLEVGAGAETAPYIDAWRAWLL